MASGSFDEKKVNFKDIVVNSNGEVVVGGNIIKDDLHKEAIVQSPHIGDGDFNSGCTNSSTCGTTTNSGCTNSGYC